MTKEKVKTDEKYGLGEIIQTHANACDNFRPPAGSLRCTELTRVAYSATQTEFCADASFALFYFHIFRRSIK
jgi:hypothetical protein